MKIKHLFVSILLVTGFQPMIAQSALRQQFVNSPVQEARPWTFWYWMFGAVTPEGITADLEAMHRIGLGGAYLMPIKGVEQGPQYEGKAQQLTPEWWRMVTHSMREADRLGMQLGMHICDGFALAGGPWITIRLFVNIRDGIKTTLQICLLCIQPVAEIFVIKQRIQIRGPVIPFVDKIYLILA